jgi:hypothetical protein
MTLSSSAIRARKRKKTQRSQRFLLSNSTRGRVTALKDSEAEADRPHQAAHGTADYHLTCSVSLTALPLPFNSNRSRRYIILALQCRHSKHTTRLITKTHSPDLHNLNGLAAHCHHLAGLHPTMPAHPRPQTEMVILRTTTTKNNTSTRISTLSRIAARIPATSHTHRNTHTATVPSLA